jgi:diguanylate cyclase (GGDEF)-like protein
MNDAIPQDAELPAGLQAAMSAALDAAGASWWIKDAEGRYLHLSACGHALFGLAPGAAHGLTDGDLLSHAQAASLRAADQGALAAGEPVAGEHQIDAGGARRELSSVRVALPPQPDGRRLLLGLWFDAGPMRQCSAQLQAALMQLEQQQRANETLRAEIEGRGARDAGARLVQRDQFEEHLRREVDLSMREHREFAVVCVVVDTPPEGGPSYDAVGRERVMQSLGQLLRSNTRAMDAPCRLDDERFAVLLSGVGLATAHSRMEGVRRQCATQLVAMGGAALRFTVSMGVASFPHTSQTQDGLMHAAETALAQSLQRGGNHVALASIDFGAAPTA